jgi:ribosomal protein S21
MSKAANVIVKTRDHNAPAEKLIRKFIRKVKKSGILEEFRDRRYYTKPSDAKRLKRKRARALNRKANKKARKQN